MNLPGSYPSEQLSPSKPQVNPPPRSPSPEMKRDPLPYETPDLSGRSWLIELPEEILHNIFLKLDLGDLTRCFRVS